MDDNRDVANNHVRSALTGIREALHLLLLPGGAAEPGDSLARLVNALPAGAPAAVTAAAARVKAAPPGEVPAAAAGLLQALEDAIAPDRAIILVIDDDPGIRRTLCLALHEPGRILLEAADAASARQLLAMHPVRLILLDLMLGEEDGRNLLVQFKENVATAAIPVVMISGQNSAAVKAECAALGAAGYFEKPFNQESMLAVVRALLAPRAASDAAPLRDALTGVGNRAALAAAFAALPAVPAGPPPYLVLVDLDNLAECNAARGTGAGDAALRRVAALLLATEPAPVCVARWGGTFACLYAGAALPDLVAALEQVRSGLADAGAACGMSVNFSAGFGRVVPGRLEETLAVAGRHLEQAKACGRNCTVTPESVAPGRRYRVLLAEDDELIVAMVKHFLAREEVDCVPVSDGQAALDAMARGGYDLALLDGRMPVLDGVQVLRRLRAQPATAAVPVMMLTGLSAAEDISRALELGANDYLTKPFSPTELVARVRRLLRRR